MTSWQTRFVPASTLLTKDSRLSRTLTSNWLNHPKSVRFKSVSLAISWTLRHKDSNWCQRLPAFPVEWRAFAVECQTRRCKVLCPIRTIWLREQAFRPKHQSSTTVSSMQVVVRATVVPTILSRFSQTASSRTGIRNSQKISHSWSNSWGRWSLMLLSVRWLCTIALRTP